MTDHNQAPTSATHQITLATLVLKQIVSDHPTAAEIAEIQHFLDLAQDDIMRCPVGVQTALADHALALALSASRAVGELRQPLSPDKSAHHRRAARSGTGRPHRTRRR